MSLQNISVAESVENALRLTFIPNKSRMEIEPALANQTNAMILRAAGLVNCVQHRLRGVRLKAQGTREKARSQE